MTETTDILVIGGGIAGVNAAAMIARHAKVTVLESELQLGYHSTGRSAAIFILNYGNATLRALNAVAYPELLGGMIGENVLSPRGELLVARPQDVPTLEAYLEGTDGVDRLTPDEAVALVPVLKRDQIALAAYESEAQDIDVDRLLQGCTRLLRERGGQIVTGQKVLSLEAQAGGWRVRTGGQDYTARIVVNAAGAWAEEIAALAGAPRIGLQPMRRSAVIMPVPEGLTGARDWPLFASAVDDWYAKPESSGLMISPADEDPIDPCDAWPDDMVLAEGLHRFEQMVDIPIVKPSHSWAGLRSFVPDHTPVCGFDPVAEGFFWLAGQGGYGVQTAPALAALAEALVLGKTPALPESVVAALSPERFG